MVGMEHFTLVLVERVDHPLLDGHDFDFGFFGLTHAAQALFLGRQQGKRRP